MYLISISKKIEAITIIASIFYQFVEKPPVKKAEGFYY